VAVSFTITFDLALVKQLAAGGFETETVLNLEGSCSHNPTNGKTSDVLLAPNFDW